MMASKAEREYTGDKLDKHEADIELMKGCHLLYSRYGLKEGILIVCDKDDKLLDITTVLGMVIDAYWISENSKKTVKGMSSSYLTESLSF